MLRRPAYPADPAGEQGRRRRYRRRGGARDRPLLRRAGQRRPADAGVLRATAAVLDANPDIDMVGIDAYLFDDDDGQDQIRSYRQSVGITTDPDVHHPVTLVEVIGGNVIYYTAAIRAQAWQKGGGDSCDTPKVEDLAMFMRMLAAGCDIRVLNERLARYRLRDNSFSRDPAQVTRSRRAWSGRSCRPPRCPTRRTCNRRWTPRCAGSGSTRPSADPGPRCWPATPPPRATRPSGPSGRSGRSGGGRRHGLTVRRAAAPRHPVKQRISQVGASIARNRWRMQRSSA